MRASMISSPASATCSWMVSASAAGDRVEVGAQRVAAVLVAVVPAGTGHRAQRRFALDGDVGDVVGDIEGGARRVGDTPDDDGADLDRVAGAVVDLERRRVEVIDAQRDALALVEGIDPEEAVVAQAAGIAAEEGEYRGDVGRLDHEALGQENQHGQRNEAVEVGRRAAEEDAAGKDMPERGGEQRQPDRQCQPAGKTACFPFFADFTHRHSPCMVREQDSTAP